MFTKIGSIGAMLLIWGKLEHKLDNAGKNGKKLRSLNISLSCWIKINSACFQIYIIMKANISSLIFMSHSLGFCFVLFFFFLVIWKIKIHYCICRRPGFDSWVKKISWRREWLPTLVFLPGEFHGQRSLVSYSPWGHIESNMTERLTHTYTHTHTHRA